MSPDKLIEVVLVDEKDNQIGTMEKIAAHSNGAKLHRAFSVFVFNSKGETLLQRRAMEKYHSKGVWSNTCCSHPYVGESVESAAHRRLEEELGFDCDLKERFSFIYKTEVGNNLTEHEFDHILTGKFEGEIKPNPDEVMDYKWIKPELLLEEMKKDPKSYTLWMKIAIERLVKEGIKS